MPHWRKIDKECREFLLNGWEEDGLAGRLSRDGRRLIRKFPNGKVQRWKLPGKGQANDVVRPILVSGEELFMLNVSLKKGRRALAVCRPNGRITLEWQAGGMADLEAGADGSLWEWWGELYVITPQGIFLPPINVQPVVRKLLGQSKEIVPWQSPVVHVTESSVWLIINHQFLVTLDNHTGKPLQKWRLPNTPEKRRFSDETIHVAEAGFFFHSGRDLYFITWDGEQTNLGKA